LVALFCLLLNTLLLDPSPDPGASRPFNFFGTLDVEDMDHLSSALHEFSDARHNHTIVFGHYPLVTISDTYSSRGETLSELTQLFSVYLCGHLHTATGLAHRMYARHLEGFLELEVADLGWSHEYRVFAVDHDLLSFTDTPLDRWPIVVITNPKDAAVLAPEREPFGRIAASSHLRFLAFSPHELTSFHIEIDGEPHPEPVTRAVHMSGGEKAAPLYVARWNPSSYSKGVHEISITVTDKAGNTVTKTQKFSVDGTTVELLGLGRLLLSLNFNFLVKLAFLGADAMTLALLLLPTMWVRYLNYSNPAGFALWRKAQLEHMSGVRSALSMRSALSSPATFFREFSVSTLLRFAELSQRPSVLLPLVAYGVYIPFFPWFIGRFIRYRMFSLFERSSVTLVFFCI